MDYLTKSKINAETLAVAQAKGLTITVEYDDDTSAYNPRDHSNSKIVTSVRGRKTFSDDTLSNDLWGNNVTEAAQNYARENDIDFNDMIYITVYGYSHGGFTISASPFSCPWDSGVVGFIFKSKKAVREEFGVKRISKKLHQEIIDRLTSEIEDVDYWLNSTYYSVSVSDSDDNVECLCGVTSDDDKHTSDVALDLIAQIEALEECA